MQKIILDESHYNSVHRWFSYHWKQQARTQWKIDRALTTKHETISIINNLLSSNDTSYELHHKSIPLAFLQFNLNNCLNHFSDNQTHYLSGITFTDACKQIAKLGQQIVSTIIKTYAEKLTLQEIKELTIFHSNYENNTIQFDAARDALDPTQTPYVFTIDANTFPFLRQDTSSNTSISYWAELLCTCFALQFEIARDRLLQEPQLWDSLSVVHEPCAQADKTLYFAAR